MPKSTVNPDIKILVDDLSSRKIADFLNQHMADMISISPPESRHALDLDGLRSEAVTFWSVYEKRSLLGCGAIKQLDSTHGEIKSMRTAQESRGKGIASMLLMHILDVSKTRGYKRVSLETGSMDFFVPARELYLKHGFEYCSAFDHYREDPNSLFMTLKL